MKELTSYEEIIDETIATLVQTSPFDYEYRVYTAGTGFPDDLVIQAYNGTGVPVVDRNWVMWKDGKKVD